MTRPQLMLSLAICFAPLAHTCANAFQLPTLRFRREIVTETGIGSGVVALPDGRAAVVGSYAFGTYSPRPGVSLYDNNGLQIAFSEIPGPVPQFSLGICTPVWVADTTICFASATPREPFYPLNEYDGAIVFCTVRGTSIARVTVDGLPQAIARTATGSILVLRSAAQTWPPTILNLLISEVTLGGFTGGSISITLPVGANPGYVQVRGFAVDAFGNYFVSFATYDGSNGIAKFGPAGGTAVAQSVWADPGPIATGCYVDRAGVVMLALGGWYEQPVRSIQCYDNNLQPLGAFGGTTDPVGPFDTASMATNDRAELWAISHGYKVENGLGQYQDYLVCLNQDADADGLADNWEELGLCIPGSSGQRLTLGSSPTHKDLFIEVDAMQHHELRVETMAAVRDTFGAINNSLFAVPNPDGENGITVRWAVAAERNQIIADTPWLSSQWAPFRIAKRAAFGQGNLGDEEYKVRNLVYHYGIVAHGGLATDTGFSEQGGNDFIIRFDGIALGQESHYSGTVNEQAGTLMHELGHKLGLDHGGADSINYKPNYRSVMNYAWQVPGPQHRGEWRASYSWRSYLRVLNEVSLQETQGIGLKLGKRGWHAFYGPPYVFLGVCALPFESEVGAFDWTQANGIQAAPVAVNINRGILSEMQCTGTGSDSNEMLMPCNDWGAIRFGNRASLAWVGDGIGGTSGDSGSPELQISTILAMREAPLDCDADGIIDAAEIAGGAPDVDCNGMPDKCDGPRIVCEEAIVALCPGGDAGAIEGTVDLSGMCGVDLESGSLSVVLLRDDSSSPAITLFDDGGSPCDDVIAVPEYDPATHIAHFSIARGSGCGTLVMNARVNGIAIDERVEVRVRGIDIDARVIGAVDRFDQETFFEHYFNQAECADLNGDGAIYPNDIELLTSHLGHSVPRQVIFPNDGFAGWTTGYPMKVTWQRGVGDSSRVEICARCGPQRTRQVLAHAVPDTGYALVPAVAGLDTCFSFAVEVRHTAGTFEAGLQGVEAGSDTSDAPSFAIDGIAPSAASIYVGLITDESVTLHWTAPGDDQNAGRVAFYDVRYSSQPITLANCDGATQACCVETIHPAGSAQLLTVGGLASSHLYYFGLRSRDEGNNKSPLTTTSVYTMSEGGGGWGTGESQRRERSLNAAIAEGSTGADPKDRGAEAAIVAVPGIGVTSSTGVLGFEKHCEGDTIRLRVYWLPEPSRSDAQRVAWQSRSVTGTWRDSIVYTPTKRIETLGIAGGADGSDRLTCSGVYPVGFPSTVGSRGRTGLVNFERLDMESNISGRVDQESLVTKFASLAVGEAVTATYVRSGSPARRAADGWLLAFAPTQSAKTAPELASGASTPAGTPALPREFALHSATPNPAAASVDLKIDLPRASRVRLDVLDIQGRLVRRLARGAMIPGTHVLHWDLASDRGGRVRPGMYLIKLEVESGPRRVLKLVVGS